MTVGDRDGKFESLWFGAALLPGGWASSVRLSLAEGRIAAIETDAPREPGEPAYGLAVPGLPNLHSHAFQRGMAGLAEARGPGADSFWTWREAMYRFVDRLGPEDLEAIAAQAYVEMLESGFTRVGEFHYLHHDPRGEPYANPAEMAERLAAAAQEAGIGLTLLPVFYAHSGFGGAAPGEGQRRFVHDLDSFARLLQASGAALSHLADARLGAAPHSLRAVTEAELTAVAAMTPGPLHIHVAEQEREVEDCLAWSGQRPVAWLLDRIEIDRRWCLVHATHMIPAEIAALAASGAVAGLCPITEANLGDGVFPAQVYLSQGGAFGIGSDSNVLVDAAEELRLLEYSQRLTHRARNILATWAGGSTGRGLLQGAVAGGARALSVEAGLQVGAAADIVSLDLAHPSLVGRTPDQAIDSWIFAARGGAVEHVWRRGRRVVEHGRHHRREEIARRFRQVLEPLLS